MKGFLKCLAAVIILFGAIIAALVIFDKLSNKHRFKGDYLECDVLEDDVDEFDED